MKIYCKLPVFTSRPSSSSAIYWTFVFFCTVFMLLFSTFSLSAETKTYVSFNWSPYWFSFTFLLEYLQKQLKRNNDTSFHFEHKCIKQLLPICIYHILLFQHTVCSLIPCLYHVQWDFCTESQAFLESINSWCLPLYSHFFRNVWQMQSI